MIHAPSYGTSVNQLIDGYATVKISTVWNVTQNALQPWLDAVTTLMDELGET